MSKRKKIREPNFVEVIGLIVAALGLALGIIDAVSRIPREVLCVDEAVQPAKPPETPKPLRKGDRLDLPGRTP
jgi:hypothetical protein